MTEFLDLLESVRAEDASINRLFGDAGSRIRGMRRDDPRYQRSLAEAADLVAATYQGRSPIYRLQEAMSTSDFPLLFGDILDRQLLGAYAEWPTTWATVAKRSTVRDFRTVKRFAVDGARAVLDKVKQGSEYPEAKLAESPYEYAVEKRGRRVPLLWELFVNDDLDAFRDTPVNLATAARNSEDKFATELYAGASGPNTTFFSAANGNLLPNTADNALATSTLQAAFNLLWSQRDPDGIPIFTGRVRLVVPPQLAVTARNILNATTLRVIQTGLEMETRNWVAGEIADLAVNPWLPIVSSTANGATSWYLFADPGVGRPAMEVGFLRGHETPELFMKSPNATRVGGGVVAAEDGDFETDGVNYKVRHVFGGTLLSPKAAVASDGSNAVG